MSQNQPANNIQVISRAATILRVLGAQQGGMTFGMIAKETGLARSTVQRIIGALSAENFVAMDASGRGFRLSEGLLALYAEPDAVIIRRYRQLLENISAATKETVDLSVLRKGKMLFLDQIQGEHRLRAVSSTGESFPLATTACGRACLAVLPEAQQRSVLDPGAHREDDLSAVQNAKQRGYAIDENEHTQGISAVGIVVDSNPARPIAISVPVPSTRFQAILPTVLKCLLPHRAQTRAQPRAQH